MLGAVAITGWSLAGQDRRRKTRAFVRKLVRWHRFAHLFEEVEEEGRAGNSGEDPPKFFA